MKHLSILSILCLSVSLLAQDPHLVTDLNTDTAQNHNGAGTVFGHYNGHIYFSGNDGYHPNSLWRSDGTEATLFLDAFEHTELYPLENGEMAIATNNSLYLTDGTDTRFIGRARNGFAPTVMGDHIYYHGYSPEGIYRTDGTSTEMVFEADLRNPDDAQVFGDRLYVWDDFSPYTLTVTDGTQVGSFQVNIESGDLLVGTHDLGGGRFLFVMYHWNNRYSLWTTDGTQAGTRSMVTGAEAITVYPSGSGYIALVAGDQPQVLWTDGTQAGTSTLATPPNLVHIGIPMGGQIAFAAGDPRQVWVTDGTSAGTQAVVTSISVPRLYPGPGNTTLIAGPGSLSLLDAAHNLTTLYDEFATYPRTFHTVGDKVFFIAETTHQGQEIWVTDGTANGTKLLQDINPGNESTELHSLTAWNGRAYFFATGTQPQLYVSDGDTTETLMTVTSPHIVESYDLGDRLIFPYLYGLLGTDGTAAGTEILYDNNVYAFPKVHDGQLYFVPTVAPGGSELWISDGTVAGTVQKHDVNRDRPDGITLSDETNRNGKLLALAYLNGYQSVIETDGSAHGTQIHISDAVSKPIAMGGHIYYTSYRDRVWGLWRTDGSTEERITDLAGPPDTIETTGDTLYWYTSYNREMWSSDGTEAGTQMFAEGTELVMLNDVPYFLHDERLYRGDGTPDGNVEVAPELPRLWDIGNQHIYQRGDRLFFFAGFNTPRPYVSDGTEAGTRLLLPQQPLNPSINNPPLFTATADGVYFSHNDGQELWFTDYTEAGTVRVATLDNHFGFFQGFNLEGNTALFWALKKDDSKELWRSNGHPGGTYPLRSFQPFAHVDEGVVASGIYYFSGFDPAEGNEPWRSDGTAPGTYQLPTIWPGPGGSHPQSFNQVGGQVYFTAIAPDVGRELFSFCDAPDATISGEPSICVGSEGTLSVPVAAHGASYDWQLTHGTLVADEGNSIRFTADGTDPVTISVTVTLTEGCFATGTYTVTPTDAAPADPGVILGATEPCTFADEIYEVAEVADTSYTWTVPAGAAIVQGQGSHRVVVRFGQLSGDVTVTPTNACGDGPTATLAVTLPGGSTEVDAGPDADICGSATSMNATLPAGFNGTWSVVQGIGGTFDDPTDPFSSFSGVLGEHYLLRLTANNGLCPDVFDEVRVHFFQAPTVAYAGEDRDVCGTYGTSLEGNTPTSGTGMWTVVSGEGAELDNPYSPTSYFRGEANETYILAWTIDGGGCGSSTDHVTIQMYEEPEWPEAGPNRWAVLGEPVTLSATAASVGIGTWSVLWGPDTSSNQFSDIHDPAAQFTASAIGAYNLSWEVTHGPCANRSDSVELVADLAENLPFLVADLDPGLSSSSPHNLKAGPDGYLYGASYVGSFRTDGTEAGTEILLDERFVEYTFLNGDLIVTYDSPTYGEEVFKLTPGGSPQLLLNLTPGSSDSDPREFFLFNGKVYFFIRDNYQHYELWCTDGTPGGTTFVAEVGDLHLRFNPVVAGTKAFFFGNDPDHGNELWVTDGTPAGTGMVVDLNEGTADGIPWGAFMGAFDNRVVFSSFTSDDHTTISDGTLAGTQTLSEVRLNNLPVQSGNYLFLPARVGFNSSMYAMNNNLNLTDLGEGGFSPGLDVNGTFVFEDYQLFRSNGTLAGTQPILDEGNPINDVDGLYPSESGFWFERYNGELWHSGTADETAERKMSIDFVNPQDITESGGLLYFAIYTQELGTELYALSLPPSATINTAAVCSAEGQTASVPDAGPGASYYWHVDGGVITEGHGTNQIQFVADQPGEVIVEAEVVRPGGVANDDSRLIQADPIEFDLWQDDARFQGIRDVDGNGIIDVRDYSAHFTGCYN